ncbi:MAG: S26 family signal peptidase [Halobacteriaceae archaeon]
MTDRDPDGDSDPRSEPRAALNWLRTTDTEPIAFLREALASAMVVVIVGMVLFVVSGIWPPLVAVESGSMQPQLGRGDLVFIMDEDRLVPEAAKAGTGIVTYQRGRAVGYRSFGDYGDVIVFDPPDRPGAPVIHRARLWVTEGERWVEEANPSLTGGRSCDQIPTCPAPHAGFITKGDANPYYDQVQGIATVVKPAWIRGTAEFAVPWLGYVRLTLGQTASIRDAVRATVRGPTAPRTFAGNRTARS